MRGDIAEQLVGMGRAPALRRRMCESAVGQPVRLVELVEPQGGPTQRIAGFSVDPDDTSPRLTLEKVLALAQEGQRLSGLADLRQRPGRARDGMRKVEDDVARPVRRQPLLDQCARLRPISFEKVKPAGGQVRHPDGVGMTRRLGEPQRLGLVLQSLVEPAELSEPLTRR